MIELQNYTISEDLCLHFSLFTQLSENLMVNIQEKCTETKAAFNQD